VVIGYVAIELFTGVGRFAGDNIAHFAHLGGALFGFILIKALGVKKPNNFY
jgi:membrane associated rhomboid family serine protease